MINKTKNKVPQVAINDIGNKEQLIEAVDNTISQFKNGDFLNGVVIRIGFDEVLLDVKYKTEGVIPIKELSVNPDVNPNELLKIGDKIETLVLEKEDEEGRLILSRKRAVYEHAWKDLETIKQKDEIISGDVIDVVRGGLILDVGIRGFMPASLIDSRRITDFEQYKGQKIDAKIVELDRIKNNVVLSHRAILEEKEGELREKFLADLHVGQIRKGKISSIVSFGAFVDLGGMDGLVHVSELSWNHVMHPSEVVKVGDEVTVEVLSIETEKSRISLSIKSTESDPWQEFARSNMIGQIVAGEVVKLVTFGAFIKLSEGVEGLIHISELADSHIDIPDAVISLGEHIYTKITDINLENRRISLSLKQANTGVDPDGEDFDPALYGMKAEYDKDGNYKFPEGFDAAANEWKPGFEEQRAVWEAEYAKAYNAWESHKKQVRKMIDKSDSDKKLDKKSAEKVDETVDKKSAEKVDKTVDKKTAEKVDKPKAADKKTDEKVDEKKTADKKRTKNS
ncbi:MAG: 30S ribosomal protein S1 [Bifidobacteriaceae bacterium]|jgi:small subunit ribosomal protein S1|nr:30S ribosomal protein S1 [Bifidobacteriaceae bacterium]